MSLLQNQGVLIGAFQKGTLVGITSVENQPRGKVGNYRKMDILFVSKQYRNQGIGANLLNLAKEKAKLFGGTKLYISAIPSKSTVDFYLREGATLVSEIDKELYQLEPDDIHLEVQIGF
ncbi:GNAT family N-acetyltransferase [Leptospira sp. WS92.C1]